MQLLFRRGKSLSLLQCLYVTINWPDPFIMLHTPRVSSRGGGGGGQRGFRPPHSESLGGISPPLYLLIQKETCHQGIINSWLCYSLLGETLVEAMFFRFKNPLFPFCHFANSVSYTKLPNSPDFTGFYWILADSTKIF